MSGYLGLTVVALFAVILFAPRVSRRLRRVNRATGTAAVSPPRTYAAGETAVPRPEAEPQSAMTGPYAYDSILIAGNLEEGP